MVASLSFHSFSNAISLFDFIVNYSYCFCLLVPFSASSLFIYFLLFLLFLLLNHFFFCLKDVKEDEKKKR